MKRKKLNQKDYLLRQLVKKKEDQRTSWKTIQSSALIESKNRFLATLQLSKGTGKVNKIRNRCVLTGRSRGVYNYFKISRIMINELASQGLLGPGVKKASW